MVRAYDRYVECFAEPHLLNKEEMMKWVELSRAANKARTWANSNCTPEMIVDCDLKIRASEDSMMRTHEGRAGFLKSIMEMWSKVLPEGEVALGMDGLMKLNDLFNPMIDAINAPHENAHWNWEPTTAKAAYDYSAKIFGYEGKFTMQQWVAMVYCYDR